MSKRVERLARRREQSQSGTAKSVLHPELVAELLKPQLAPTSEERYGLEQFLRRQEATREVQYHAFRQHWYRLQERDFRRQLLEALEQVTAAV